MVCAYCGSKSRLSREHVIPDWFIKTNKNQKGMTFNERAVQKFVKDIVVKDVCEGCNNGPLSDLDNYGKSLYNRYFLDFVYEGETVWFEYDFQKLVKWLIKCSYNSNRANTKNGAILKMYAKFLLSDLPLPNGVLVFCSLSAPTILENGITTRQASRDEAELSIKPMWFRIGHFRFNKSFDQSYCFRSVIINSYNFLIALPDYSSSLLNARRTILSKFHSTPIAGVRLNDTGGTLIGPPFQDAYSSISSHMSHNPIAYRLRPYSQIDVAKIVDDEILTLVITREQIEAEDIEIILFDLLSIMSIREIAKHFIGAVDIRISGYDEDERPLWEIRKVVKFISRLNVVFPYWLLLLSKKSDWMKVLIATLCCSNKKSMRSELIVEQKLIIRNWERWFAALNEICDKLCFEKEVVRECSEALMGYITSLEETGTIHL